MKPSLVTLLALELGKIINYRQSWTVFFQMFWIEIRVSDGGKLECDVGMFQARYSDKEWS